MNYDTSYLWEEELFVAIERGCWTIVRRMLDRRLSGYGGCGTPPLHLAVQLDRADIVKALLAREQDVNEAYAGLTPLHHALYQGQAMVDLLLAHGADANTPLTQHAHALLETVLRIASRWRNMDAIAHTLLEAGANPNLIASDDCPILQFAVQREQASVVRDLIAHGADVNAAGINGWTALMTACARGDAEMARLLLSHGADPNAAQSDGDTAVWLAIFYGFSEIEKLLLTTGANLLPGDVEQGLRDPEVVRNLATAWRDDSGQTLLHIAARTGNVNQARRLLELGLEADAPDKRGYMPLTHAIWGRSPQIVQLLLKAGADPLEPKGDKSLLQCAMDHVSSSRPGLHAEVSLAMLRLLLETGILERLPRNWYWESMLYYAVRSRYTGFVRLLLEYGLDPNSMVRGEPLIIHVIREGDFEMFSVLLEAGADIPWDWSDDRRTAFSCAIGSGSVELVRYFLEHGADPNFKEGDDVSDNWAIEVAAYTGNLELVRFLLDTGVRIPGQNTRSSDGIGMNRWRFGELRFADLHMMRFFLDMGACGADALYHAACNRDIEIIEWLIDYGVDVNARLIDGETALMGAMRGSPSLETVEVLLRHGADFNVVSDSGNMAILSATRDIAVLRKLLEAGADPNVGTRETALMFAAREGDAEAVTLLLESGADVNAVNVDGDMALRLAKDNGQDALVQILLDHGAHEPAMTETNLRAAILWNRLEGALRLIREGADVNKANTRGHSPLMMAIEKRLDMRVITALLEGGAETNQVFTNIWPGGTPLLQAVHTGHASLVRLLLAYGADPNLSDGRYYPLPDAVRYLSHPSHETRAEEMEIVRLLLDAGASPNVLDGNEGLTPLQEAARRDDIDTMGLLIDHGADLEMPCDTDFSSENTALHYAVDYLREGAARSLIERGANVNADHENGATPLTFACYRFQPGRHFIGEQFALPAQDVAEADEIQLRLAILLLQHGADVNNITDYGRTPLLAACSAQEYTQARRDLIRLLLDAGADIDVEDGWGSTPLNCAEKAGDQDVLEMFATRRAS